MPTVPSFLERTVLLTLNRAPGPMMDLAGGLAFHAISSALRLRVFDALGNNALPSNEVAQLISADARATKLLLEVLEALGYVEKKEGRYLNTKMTVKWILGSSPHSVACIFPGMQGALDRWRYIDETIRNGRPPKLAWQRLCGE